MEEMKNCVVLLNVYNSEEYLEYVLKSIYWFPRLIVVIDGAYSEKMPSHYSTDKTREIIESFPDPDKKIIYKRTWSKTQTEQRGKGLGYLEPNDWLFLVDDDEVYKEADLMRLKEFLTTTAKKDNYKLGSYTFINSFGWWRYITDPRLFRSKPNMAFIGSNNLTWDNGKKKYGGFLTVPEVMRYHYSYVRNNRRLDIKKIQTAVKNYPYAKHGRFFVREDLTPVPFEGEHPEIMKTHPYAKITWHPRQSQMYVGPRVRPKIVDKVEKKEVLKWNEFYKPFHKDDYERHIEAWKGVCHRVARFVPPGGRILEIGFGTGMMSIYLSKMEFYVVGFDKNPKQVERAKNLCREVEGGARFACRNLFDLDGDNKKVGPLKIGTYHACFSQGMLEHFTDKEIRRALEIQFKIAHVVVFSVPIDKFGHKSKGDERLLSDSFWRRMISKYELLHFSKFARETQIIVAIRRREVNLF